ncbi:solute carrier family 23 member 2-like isoform X2 [Haliotis rubra]|uniref:solute carrier family 23 member 2-like isoform X2 n=1 Tax=Haliotis rubra TaxID=36100 RepID=UPI001EE58105|nr:solute carrier family 23 member 2-like isoform X2 [Haliotis rubra]
MDGCPNHQEPATEDQIVHGEQIMDGCPNHQKPATEDQIVHGEQTMDGCPNHQEPASEDQIVEMDISHNRLLYTVDKPPSPVLWPIYGIQALLVIVGALAAAVLITNRIGADELPEVRSEMLSLCLFTSGLASLLQICFGCRLPLVQGSNSGFIIAITATLSDPKWSDESLQEHVEGNGTSPWKIRLREIQGNLMLASGTQFLLGISGILGFIMKFIGPLTVAPCVTTIGVTLCGYMIPLCEQHWGIASMSILLILLFSLFLVKVKLPFPACNGEKKCHVIRYPLFQLNAMLLAMAASFIVCHVLTVTDMLPRNSTIHGHMARTDVRMSALQDAGWFYIPLPFKYGPPTISGSGYVSMLTITMIVVIQLPGIYQTVALGTEVPPPPSHAINRGLAVDGLSGAVSGMLGGVCASVVFVESLGVIAVTKVASRAVFVTAAFLTILMGIIGKFGALFSLIPDPVIGGFGLVTMSMVIAVGVSMFRLVNLSSSRNLMIMGFSMALGLLLPDWVAKNVNSINTGKKEFDQVIVTLLSTPMFVSSFVGCTLDNLAPGTPEIRGLSRRQDRSSGIVREDVCTDDPYKLPYISSLLSRLRCCVFLPISPSYDPDISCRPCQRRERNPSQSAADNPVVLTGLDAGTEDRVL